MFELQRSGGGWTFTSLHNFGAYLGPFDKPTFDAAGNLYGAVFGDAVSDMGRIFKLTSSGGGWTESDIFTFDGTDGVSPIGSVLPDASGHVYGTTSGEGAGYGVLWELRQ